MNRRCNDYFYKTCELEKMSSLDKKRYEYCNEFGYNFDSSSKRVVDFDTKIKKHKNSESK